MPASSGIHASCRYRRLQLLCALPLAAALAHADDSPEKLEQLRARIREVQAEIQSARDESDSILAELEQAEAAAAAVGASLRELARGLEQKQARLAELASDRAAQEQQLERERAQLAAQVRAAYQAGRNDFLKLLLNQEDPALFGRTLAYHDYVSRARARNIGRIGAALEELRALERDIAQESAEFARLEALERERLAELESRRASRGEVMARLRQYITEQDRELQVLQRSERDLSTLIERLGGEAAAIEAFEKLPPFRNLRGSLAWPVAGDVSVSFGAPRKGGRLRAHGVTINAPAGSEVRAIGDGMVIFADWFRNLGLLIIVDHGEGFMSLYGHNQALARKAGDMVRGGDVIAQVGDTGGQETASLYFEIRDNGSPVDPALWCRR